MTQITVSLALALLYLYSGSVAKTSSKMTMKVLQNGDVGKCLSMEEREKARNEIYTKSQIPLSLNY